MARQPLIAITAGEPAGIGPDLTVAMTTPADATVIVIADPDLLRTRAELLGINRSIVECSPDDSPALLHSSRESTREVDNPLLVWPVKLPHVASPGVLNPANAQYVLDTISLAVAACADSRIDAMVTGPVHKGIINDAGIPFSGHTEFIARMLNATPLMVLASGDLRVALVTTHLPLSAVPAAVTDSAIQSALQILHDDLRNQFAIDSPRILVCGLNPHAGESGHLGREEIEVISPALEKARARGIDARGPLPADTLFTPRHLQHADAVLAMFHDQGLPVLKYAGFGEAVNITLGLPIIRTSVDHGTAIDLAGSGDADGGSLNAALAMAISLAQKQLASC